MSRNFTKDAIIKRLESSVTDGNDFNEQSVVKTENVDSEPTMELKPFERVALFAGSFKPPHYGHLSVVRHLSRMDVDRVVVLISDPKKNKRSDITPQAAKEVFEMYATVDEKIGSEVDFEVSPTPSPISAVYDFIADAGPEDKIVIATSEKDSKRYNQERMNKWSKENGNGATVTVGIIPAVKVINPETGEDMDMSARHMRVVLEKYPNISEKEKEKVFGYMHPNMSPEMKEEAFKKLAGPETVQKGMDLVDKLVEQLLSETIRKKGDQWCLKSKKSGKNLGCYSSKKKAKKREQQVNYFKSLDEEELEEISAMGVGSASGYAGKVDKKNKRSKQTN